MISSSSLSFFRRIGITATTVAFTLTLFYYGRTTSIQAFLSSSSSLSFAAPSLFSLAQQQQQQLIPSSCSSSSSSALQMLSSSSTTSATTATTKVIPSWDELKTKISLTSVGKALDDDKYLRSIGKGSPNVHNKLRLFNDNKEDTNDDSKDNKETNTKTKYTIYRDHAGWCPYCQKTMLLIEAKNIPISIELINMRSYGDKPNSFLRKVPNGLLPALEENGSNSNKVILDSAYIMEYLENEYSSNDNENYKQMIPSPSTQPEQYQRYTKLMNLERELFSWWCTFMFRQEQPNPNSNKSNGNNNSGGNSNGPMDLLSKMFSTRDKDGNYIENEDANESDDSDDLYVSPSMNGFLNCLETVNTALSATDGSYFLDYTIDHPTMIDFIFASHIERMIASCAYWKGMNIRSEIEYPKLFAIQKWMNSLEKYDYYLAFKSDYYTHIKDIPPQYGPSSYGVSRLSKIKQYKLNIDGGSDSWTLPLSDNDTLQPLYNGIPLPKPVLESVNIKCDNDGSYKTSGSKNEMKLACQLMAVWKLCGTFFFFSFVPSCSLSLSLSLSPSVLFVRAYVRVKISNILFRSFLHSFFESLNYSIIIP
jgi:glutathione S-transferase